MKLCSTCRHVASALICFINLQAQSPIHLYLHLFPPPPGTLLSAKHAAERFDACWHGGVATIEALREQMATLLDEYLASGDLK